jgi:hypothetical protein
MVVIVVVEENLHGWMWIRGWLRYHVNLAWLKRFHHHSSGRVLRVYITPQAWQMAVTRSEPISRRSVGVTTEPIQSTTTAGREFVQIRLQTMHAITTKLIT